MKNLTGSAIMWKGQVYLPEEEVPEAIAKEMGLTSLNKAAEASEQSK